jgi:hypothetical protein
VVRRIEPGTDDPHRWQWIPAAIQPLPDRQPGLRDIGDRASVRKILGTTTDTAPRTGTPGYFFHPLFSTFKAADRKRATDF